MEDKSLQELISEYMELIKIINEQKERLEKAIESKENIEKELEEHRADYDSALEKYNAKKSILSAMEILGCTSKSIKAIKEEIQKGEKEAREIENTIKVYEEKLENAKKEFTLIEEEVQEQDDKINSILVNFGKNEKLNVLFVEEFENGYNNRINQKKAERDEIDETRIKISEDSKIEQNVLELKKLLEEFESVKSKPENSSDLDELSKKIKSKRNSIRKGIRKYIGKGGKLWAKEIDSMTTEKDEDGKFIIPELNRRKDKISEEIEALTTDKEEIIIFMEVTLELFKDIEQETGLPKYEEFLKKMNKLAAEIQYAQIQKSEGKERLDDILKEKKELEERREQLLGDIDSEKIAKLQGERQIIEDEKVGKITNPEIIQIQSEIEELEEKERLGAEKVETEEYKKLELYLKKISQKLYQEQRRNFSIFIGQENGNEDNPRYIELLNQKNDLVKKLEQAEEVELQSMNRKVETNGIHVQLQSTKNFAVIEENEIKKTNKRLIELREKILTEYVSEDIYEALSENDIEDPLDESDEKITFERYRKEELSLRKAMIELQKNPSRQTRENLNIAIAKYKIATKSFQDALAYNIDVVPSERAVHKYLLGVLNKEKPQDEAYDVNNVKNRIKLIDLKGKNSTKIKGLELSTNELDKILEKILIGEEISEKVLDEAVANQIDSIENFDNPSKVTTILSGYDLPRREGKFSFLRRLFPRRKIELNPKYCFEENTPPKECEEYVRTKKDLVEMQDRREKYLDKISELEARYKEGTEKEENSDYESDIENLKAQIYEIEAELVLTPKKIKNNKLSELSNLVRETEKKLKSTQRYCVTEDLEEIRKHIEELKNRKSELPYEISDSAKQDDKDRRIREKDDEIEKLSHKAEIASINGRLSELQESEENTLHEQDASERVLDKLSTLKSMRQRYKILEAMREKILFIKSKQQDGPDNDDPIQH